MGKYSMTFQCKNCSQKWEKMIDTGKKIVYKRSEKRSKIVPEDAMKIGEIEIVECPNCETKEKVRPVKPQGVQTVGGKGWAM